MSIFARADRQFEKLAFGYIEARLRMYPEDATALGDHRFDGELTDYSEDARSERLELHKTLLRVLGSFEYAGELSDLNRIDFQIFKENVEAEIFSCEELNEAVWNPLVYNQSLAYAVHLLVAREFAPLTHRLQSVRKRLEKIPRVIEQAKANLQNPPRIYTETAVEQVQGGISFIREILSPTLSRFVLAAGDDIGSLRDAAVSALEDYSRWLQEELLPRSKGDYRLGRQRFDKKLRFVLGSAYSRDQVRRQAYVDLKEAQNAIYETAALLCRQYLPAADKRLLGDKKKLILAILDALAEQRPNENTIVDQAKAIVLEATDFVRDRDLVTIPDEPLEVIQMPEFRRGLGVAYCDSVGPLDRHGQTFYAIAPPPSGWSDEKKESFFREYNNHMLRDVTLHEAMPGHYLQLMHANRFRAPTQVRAVFRSGTFIEGWAVYSEQLMTEAGYGGPEVKMEQLKMRLRVICNALVDQSVHASSMTEPEALDLLINQGFQQEAEATAKWKRALLSSAQLSTYYVGVSEHLALRERVQKRLGNEFDLKKYHDELLSFGSPPMRYVRELTGW